MTELPLFPLNTVLFPGMPLPLHIFEERYKLMINHCLQGDRTFGVVLIKEGEEVGEPAVPYRVGTLAKIVEVYPLEDGRLNLLTLGEERFRIIDILQQTPYLTGIVEPLVDPQKGEPGIEDLIQRGQALLGRYVQQLLALSGQWKERIPLPQDAATLSYKIASYLQVDLRLKQELLETPSAARRLKQELELLEPECERLRKRVVWRWRNLEGGSFSRN